MAFTFRPHPYFVLRPSDAPQLINTYEEKIELLGQHGIQCVMEEPFSREFSNITPEEFVKKHLIESLGTHVLYLGYDFAFGKARSGSVETLKALAQENGIEIHVVPARKIGDKTVSSSLIRHSLEEGDIAFVNECLGRRFFLRGLVWRGEGRGRTIGVPTANMQTVQRKYPRVGVYATRTLWRGKWYSSVSNVGYNPTFKGDADDLPLKIETHLFDFEADMYGDEIQVDFLAYLRPEKKFAGVHELLAQMQLDFAAAREKNSKEKS
jgi:riboflavin kinase/FMN adenylyltransferase